MNFSGELMCKWIMEILHSTMGHLQQKQTNLDEPIDSVLKFKSVTAGALKNTGHFIDSPME